MRIEVSAEDIEGAGEGGANCPVARALHRQGFPRAFVSSLCIFPGGVLSAALTDTHRPLSARMRRYVKLFDAGHPVDPISFEIDL